MLESGLAATVNMQSIRPLAIGKRRVAMTVDGAYNEQARGSIRPHISALYTDTFLDNRLGWSIAVDINKLRINDQQFATAGVIQDSPWDGRSEEHPHELQSLMRTTSAELTSY